MGNLRVWARLGDRRKHNRRKGETQQKSVSDRILGLMQASGRGSSRGERFADGLFHLLPYAPSRFESNKV